MNFLKSLPARMKWSTTLALVCGLLSSGLLVSHAFSAQDPAADPKTKSLPLGWDQAYFKIITTPDYPALEKGEILYKEKQVNSDTALAQTMGLINASPEACYKAVKLYDNYTKTMPFTVESRVIRRYPLEGAVSAGAETVDFWTRVSVLGFETRYLIRIAHLEEAAANRYRTFWTLVNNPAQVPCTDSEKRPCENDLAANIGSHLFEPYKGDPKRTLHTYTLKLVGKSWMQRTALNVGGGSSMREVTERTRKAAEKK
ncbi:MAG: SRPBCC family protein [Myxococcota bacterium]